uniref:hypothetical protein n=1 Tax=Cupriavidus taiwanensis TaxID=164546 RepID=UPI003F49200B
MLLLDLLAHDGIQRTAAGRGDEANEDGDHSKRFQVALLDVFVLCAEDGWRRLLGCTPDKVNTPKLAVTATLRLAESVAGLPPAPLRSVWATNE